jgi:hypothetical protein
MQHKRLSIGGKLNIEGTWRKQEECFIPNAKMKEER